MWLVTNQKTGVEYLFREVGEWQDYCTINEWYDYSVRFIYIWSK